MNKIFAGIVAGTSVATAQAVGAISGPTSSHPKTAAWYAKLRKPSYTPPGSAFAGAWTVLDALQGYAGYRLLTSRSSLPRTLALGFWGANLLGVAGFSWVMFDRKRLDEATAVSIGMVATSAATIAAASKVDKQAAWSLVPLTAWVLFASVLQEEVWRRNA